MYSKVILLTSDTRNELIKQDSDLFVAIRLKMKLVKELEYRYGSYEHRPILLNCTLLDPQFKDIHFKNLHVNDAKA